MVNELAKALSEGNGQKFSKQLEWNPSKRFIKYSKSAVSEFYEKKYGDMPNEIRFDRIEEHRIGKVTLNCNGTKYYCQCFAIEGKLFEISWRPVPNKSDMMSKNATLIEVVLE